MHVSIKKAAAWLSLLLLVACVTPEGPAITLSTQTEALFQRYLGQMDGGGAGAFAVSPDGRNGFFTYCVGDGRCDDGELKGSAQSGCKTRAHVDCVILARDRMILRQYVAAGGSST